jgi:hypothetical protein
MALGDFDLGEETLGNEQSSEGDGGLVGGAVGALGFGVGIWMLMRKRKPPSQ